MVHQRQTEQDFRIVEEGLQILLSLPSDLRVEEPTKNNSWSDGYDEETAGMEDESLLSTEHEDFCPVQGCGIMRKAAEISDSDDDHDGEKDLERDSWPDHDEHRNRNSDQESA